MKRRIAASLVLGALSVASFGTTSAVAVSVAAPSAELEAVCPAATPGTAQCLALRRTDIAARPASAVSLLATPSGYGPADIQGAYALPAGSAGSGMTVAVIDAYDLPTAETALGVYRKQYGLPPCTTANGCFRKVNQRGGTISPAVDPSWGLEIALDIEMVSAACPKCKILLVEADSTNLSDLGSAVNRAVSMGAIAISNSYGGPEVSAASELYMDSHFYNHPGVAITASTGDCGYNCAPSSGGNKQTVQYPAASPYVVAVGGTRLARSGSTRGWTESAWGSGSFGAGSGCSLYEPKPSWQQDVACATRTEADVSAVADAPAGVAAYGPDSSGVNTWQTAGGTSVASPIVAAAFAMAGRPAAGTYPASYLYGDTADLYDVVGGSNDVGFSPCSVAYFCNGVAGYDGPTGLGTPHGIGAFGDPRSTYVPTVPVRLLDTRVGNGLSGKLVANAPVTFQITGRGGIPSNARAVTGNVTVVNSSSSWALYLGPTPTAQPTTSTINFSAGEILSNGQTVALGSGGILSATYLGPAGNTTDLVFDVTGYFTRDKTGATYHALAPARLLDTRSGNGLTGKLVANKPRTFQITGRRGIPSNATAVTGNVTVVNSTNAWAVYLGPVTKANPTTSTINFMTADVRANGLTVALGSGGKLSATYMSTAGNTTDLVFDVTGYYTAGATGARYVPLTPARLLDTRIGSGLTGTFNANEPRTLQVGGRGGVPTNAMAVSGNATVVSPSYAWAAFVGPVETATPATSTLNFVAGDILANSLTVALGPGGTLSATYISTPGNTTDLVFDVTGYFIP